MYRALESHQKGKEDLGRSADHFIYSWVDHIEYNVDYI